MVAVGEEVFAAVGLEVEVGSAVLVEVTGIDSRVDVTTGSVRIAQVILPVDWPANNHL